MGKKTVLPRIKVAIVGFSGVGKYSLGQQYAKGWIEPKETNQGEKASSPSKVVTLQEKKYEVKVMICEDLDGNESSDCDGVVLVFSVTDKQSFTYAKTTAFKKLQTKYGAKQMGTNRQSAQDEKEEPREIIKSAEKGLGVPVILVGNKVDDAKLSREVDTEVAAALSKELLCAGYFETAAICNSDVPKAFQCLLTEIASRMDSTQNNTDELKKNNSCCVLL